MVFFYRRFLPLDVYKYAFGAENDASSSNLPIPLVKPKEAVSNFAFETASFINLLFNHAKEQPRNIVINLYVAKEITVTIRIEPTA